MTKQLEPLPNSDDKEHWEHADVHTNLVPEKVVDEHYFVQITGREAECKHCGWGFALDPGDKIEDGHLFDRNGKMVI